MGNRLPSDKASYIDLVLSVTVSRNTRYYDYYYYYYYYYLLTLLICFT